MKIEKIIRCNYNGLFTIYYDNGEKVKSYDFTDEIKNFIKYEASSSFTTSDGYNYYLA